jgi:hypothetical protein
MGVTSSRSAIAFAIAAALALSSREARAEEATSLASFGSWLPPNVLTAVHGGGAGAVGSMPSGAFVGVETGGGSGKSAGRSSGKSADSRKGGPA